MDLKELLARTEEPSKRKQVLDFLTGRPQEAFTAAQIYANVSEMTESYVRKVLKSLLADGVICCRMSHYYLAPKEKN